MQHLFTACKYMLVDGSDLLFKSVDIPSARFYFSSMPRPSTQRFKPTTAERRAKKIRMSNAHRYQVTKLSLLFGYRILIKKQRIGSNSPRSPFPSNSPWFPFPSNLQHLSPPAYLTWTF
jgi:hypothetical protein